MGRGTNPMTRDKLIEAMAKRLFFEMNNIMHDHARHWAAAKKDLWLSVAKDGWSQAEHSLPGLSDYIEGKAVIVPGEATVEMLRVGCAITCTLPACLKAGSCQQADVAAWTDDAYTHMLSASPYRRG